MGSSFATWASRKLIYLEKFIYPKKEDIVLPWRVYVQYMVNTMQLHVCWHSKIIFYIRHNWGSSDKSRLSCLDCPSFLGLFCLKIPIIDTYKKQRRCAFVCVQVSKLVFYAQSASGVIPGQCVCVHSLLIFVSDYGG